MGCSRENRELTETISVKDDQEFMDHAEGGYEINTDYLKCGLSPDYDFDLSGLKVPSEQLKSRDVLFQRTIAITKQALVTPAYCLIPLNYLEPV